MHRKRTAARIVAGCSSTWVKTFRKCLSTCQPASMLFAMCAPSWPVSDVITSPKRQPPPVRFPEGLPARPYWHTCGRESSAITCRSIGKARFMRAAAWTRTVRYWPNRSVIATNCSRRWSIRFGAMSLVAARCMRMTHRYPCSQQVTDEPRPSGCGRMSGMIARREAVIRRQSGLPTRKTARVGIPASI